MTPLARRLTAKLQAARRPLTGDRQLEDEPPDDTVRITRLPAAAENVCHSSAAHRDLEENKREMRSTVCDTKPRTAAMMSKMSAEHDSLQAQEYEAAARPLRTGQHAAKIRKRGRTTSQVQQQQHIKGVSQGCRTPSQVLVYKHPEAPDFRIPFSWCSCARNCCTCARSCRFSAAVFCAAVPLSLTAASSATVHGFHLTDLLSVL